MRLTGASASVRATRTFLATQGAAESCVRFHVYGTSAIELRVGVGVGDALVFELDELHDGSIVSIGLSVGEKGEYGLRNKRELWRTQLALAKIRKSARALLTLEPKDPKRMFEAPALLRRLQRYGLVEDSEMDLDSVLQMTTQRLLERRLQTKVFKQGLAKSIHHARVLIKQRHIRVGKQVVNVPSFMVRLDSEKHVDFAATSPYGQGRPGRVARKRAAAKAAAAGGGGDGGEESD